MEKVYERSSTLMNIPMHYCPGCTHGNAHKLIAEVIDEMDLKGKTIGVSGIGCSFLSYFDIDVVGAPHGRPPATATGVKAANPDSFVFTYQGDGDCSAIGIAEALHAAGRGEKFTTFMVANGVFAMTGGQKSPYTLVGDRTTTTQDGRDIERDGHPMKMAELVAQVPGAYYVARGSLSSPKNIAKSKEYIRKAMKYQMDGKGYTFVELLSTCPTNWGISPVESLKKVDEEIEAYYPLGEILTPEGVA